MTVKQVLGFLFLQTLRAEESIIMARSQCMTGEVGTQRNSRDSGDTWACLWGSRELKSKPRLKSPRFMPLLSW